MNKLIKRLAVLSVGLTMAIGAGVAAFGHGKGEVAKAAEDTLTINSSTTNTDGTLTADMSIGTGTSTPITGSYGVRLYANNTITISSSSAITDMTIPWTKNEKKAFASVTANVGSYTHPSAAGDGVWSGEAKEIVLTVGSSGQIQLNSISYTVAGESKDVKSVAISGNLTKTDYLKGESPSAAGLVVTATYDDDSQEDITSKATITSDPATLTTVGDVNVTFTATYKEKSDSVVKTVSVTKSNPIGVLYTKSSGASVDVYGYYVGFLDGTGPVIMDGAYGIVVYNKTADVSGYIEKETILHVTGSISIYKGLYEIGSATISVASGTFEQPDEPIVHVTNGNETADQAARLTTVTGTPSLVSGSFDVAAGTADITMSFAVGIKTVQVFYKKAAQTGDAEAFVAIKDAVANSSEITIKGFTGWYNVFQVQMNGYVPAAAGYTAEDFAEDLLAQTNAADVCGDYEPDESHYAAIKAKLVAIWSDLAGAEKYPSLPSDQKTILAEANADETGDTVEKAMARYDFLTVKYDLSQFINGRSLPSSVGNRVEINNNNSLIVVIAIISAVSLVALSTLLVLKKKHK